MRRLAHGASEHKSCPRFSVGYFGVFEEGAPLLMAQKVMSGSGTLLSWSWAVAWELFHAQIPQHHPRVSPKNLPCLCGLSELRVPPFPQAAPTSAGPHMCIQVCVLQLGGIMDSP